MKLLTWDEVKQSISRVNNKLHDILVNIPDIEIMQFPILPYQYGDIIADEHFFYMPNESGQRNSVPLCLLLRNSIEMFIDSMGVSSTYRILKEGELIGVNSVCQSGPVSQPGDILQISSGARNAFMLPPISEDGPHKRLQKYFSKQISKPVDLNSHFFTFREISNSGKSGWTSELMLLPDQIVTALKGNQLPELKVYLLEYNNDRKLYSSSYGLYKSQLTRIKASEAKNISSNTFINDVVEHLFSIGVGYTPGYHLALDDSFFPVSFIRDVYKDIYGITQTPYIMVPECFDEKTNLPIYYSVSKDEIGSKPQVFSNQPAKCDLIRETFFKYSQKIIEYNVFKGTQMRRCAEKMELSLLNEKEVSKDIRHIFHIPKDFLYKYDPRFEEYANQTGYSVESFPPKTSFLNGCYGVTFKYD